MKLLKNTKKLFYFIFAIIFILVSIVVSYFYMYYFSQKGRATPQKTFRSITF